MKKPASLRAAIEAMNPDLQDNPEKLKLYVREGRIAMRAGEARGYQYVYRLEIDIINFTGNSNLIMLPVTLWLRENQPDILLNPATAEKSLKFAVDVIDNETSDLNLTLDLTESMTVTREGDDYRVSYRAEAPDHDYPLSDPASLLKKIFDDAGQLTPPVIED